MAETNKITYQPHPKESGPAAKKTARLEAEPPRCAPCNLVFNSPLQMEQHLAGRNHQKWAFSQEGFSSCLCLRLCKKQLGIRLLRQICVYWSVKKCLDFRGLFCWNFFMKILAVSSLKRTYLTLYLPIFAWEHSFCIYFIKSSFVDADPDPLARDHTTVLCHFITSYLWQMM